MTKYNLFKGIILFSIITHLFFSCNKPVKQYRSTIDLSGYWQFQSDSGNRGVEEKWFLNELKDSIQLPGTTDLSQKGSLNKDTTTMHLNRVYNYQGPAWYRKRIVIPQGWENKHIQIVMERTKSSKIWIDDQYVGKSSLLQSTHIYDLSKYLTPGAHTITIQVDNNLKLTQYGNVHIYSDDTQTNWNGIIGKFCLEASTKTFISDLQVYPDVDNKKIKVRIAIDHPLKPEKISIELQITKEINGKIKKFKPAKYELICDSILELEYAMGNAMDLWDEYHQPLYTVNAVINHEAFKDNLAVQFGMRKFITNGTQFSINGRKTFLRGKHDACVFPLTGHPPMDTKNWIRIFKIAKEYGINHYRFHSWCPPQAAFDAADQMGIYLQPELPFWGGLESDSIAEMLKTEGMAMLKSYANHPSFVMFSPGNEIWSGHDRVERNIIALKKFDNRPLYTMGSNNSIGYMPPKTCSDFFIGARTPHAHDTILTHTRLTHAFADSRDGGILNTQLPSTSVDFAHSVKNMNIPIVSHEIGQYQIYPDFREIEKYTGVVKAWNFEIFRNRLQNAGMLDQNLAFQKASGAWSALCYKAEMEAAIRTEGFAGFHLLDLQDFPGQGTALVGILDAFMDSKNVISREEWLQSCNDVVALLIFDKYCWTNTDTFTATVKVANFSNQNISNNLNWSVTTQSGTVVQKGVFEKPNIPFGGLHTVGKIIFPLSSQQNAQKLNVNITINNTKYSNTYPAWVYPEPKKVTVSNELIIASTLDANTISQLKRGKKVLLMPTTESVKNNSVAGLFPPEFWNYGMFKGISEWVKKPVSPGTLGILANPKHPIFNSFPTESHTNWQWFSIIKASRSLNLSLTEKSYRPIVQVIDNLERNNKYGLIFEFKVGEGKLLVCMSNLHKIKEKPEALQLYNSIIDYMKSDQFKPDYETDEITLNKLFK